MNERRIRQSISTITDFDEWLFTGLLANSHWQVHPMSYEGSFAFYSHRAGYFPMKFYDGHLLVPFFLRDGKYSILRPVGRWDAATVITLAAYLYKCSDAPVTFIKLSYKQFTDLLSISGFTSTEETSNLQDISDDKYSQLVSSTKHIVQSIEDVQAVKAGHFPESNYLRRAIRSFEKEYGGSFTLDAFSETHLVQAERLINIWKENFRERYQREVFFNSDDDRAALRLPSSNEFLSRPYECIIHRFSKRIDFRYNFGFISYIDDRPVGFHFLSRTSDNCAALYANLALTEYLNLSYYLIFRIIKIVTEFNIDYVNFGGQETTTLRRFFLRFSPILLDDKEDRCYDGRYIPEVV